MYLCKDCGRQFQGGLRINNCSLWNDYLTANQTISDLSILHKCSERTIRRRLSLVVDSFTATYPKSAVIILDTTYFSKTFGVMLFQDTPSGKILYCKFVKNETNRDYLDGLRYIAECGTIIKACTLSNKSSGMWWAYGAFTIYTFLSRINVSISPISNS